MIFDAIQYAVPDVVDKHLFEEDVNSVNSPFPTF